MRNAALMFSALALSVGLTGVAAAEVSSSSTTTKTTTTTSDWTPAQRTEFHQWVVKEKRPSMKVENFEVRTGATLPPEVQFYEVPKVDKYRYTVVNERRVIVDPGTRQIIDIDVD